MNHKKFWIGALLVGAPIWLYRWWTPWPTEAQLPRKAWLVFTSVIGLVTAIGAATSIGVVTALFLFSDTDPAATHFVFEIPIS